jgi:hypothetical protein
MRCSRSPPSPNSEDPGGWFFAVDVSGQGRLSRREVLNVLLTQFPIDLDRLEANLSTLWQKWDVDGSGFISQRDFVDPERGLLNWVRVHLLHEVSTIMDEEEGPAAPITPGRKAPEEWFRFCDDTNNGRLTRDQLERALVKSTRCGHAEIQRVLEECGIAQPLPHRIAGFISAAASWLHATSGTKSQTRRGSRSTSSSKCSACWQRVRRRPITAGAERCTLLQLLLEAQRMLAVPVQTCARSRNSGCAIRWWLRTGSLMSAQ